MAAEFKQDGLEHHLIIEREGEEGWYFTIATESECLWGGNLQSLVETVLLAFVCKQQLLEDMVAQRNSNPTVLLQALTKRNPDKVNEFIGMIEAAGQVGADELVSPKRDGA